MTLKSLAGYNEPKMKPENRSRLLIFLAVNSLYFFSYFQRVAVPGTVFNELQSTFSLSATAVSGLGTLTLLIYGGMQIFAGILADRLGPGRVFLTGGFLLSAGSFFFPFSFSPFMLYLMRALIGFGAGFIWISVVKELTVLFEPKDFPFYLGLSLIFGCSGGIFGTLPLERVVHYTGWRNAFLMAGAVSTLAFVWTWTVLRKPIAAREQARTFSLHGLMRVLRNIHAFPIVISGAINFGIYFLFQASLGKKFLQDCANMGSAPAAYFTFVMMATTTGFSFLSGYSSRLTGRRKVLIVFATALTLLACLILFFNLTLHGDSRGFLLAYMFLAVSAASSPIYVTSMKELNSTEVAATSVGFQNTVCYLTIALFMNLAGLVLDSFRNSAVELAKVVIYPPAAYRTIFAGCIVLAGISFLISLLIKESSDTA